MSRIAISGETNKLTIIGPSNPSRDKRGTLLYDVKCGWCGRVKPMTKWIIHCSQSCGCVRGKLISKTKVRHGAARRAKITPEFRAWSGAKNRCCNTNNKDYYNYGARGIRMCEEWLHDFPAFLEHIGPQPPQPEGKIEYSLDRIDNNGNYEPGNVRWAMAEQQSRNRRNNRIIEFDGKALCLTDWARHLGIPINTLWMRLKAGWSARRALTGSRVPPDSRKQLEFRW